MPAIETDGLKKVAAKLAGWRVAAADIKSTNDLRRCRKGASAAPEDNHLSRFERLASGKGSTESIRRVQHKEDGQQRQSGDDGLVARRESLRRAGRKELRRQGGGCARESGSSEEGSDPARFACSTG